MATSKPAEDRPASSEIAPRRDDHDGQRARSVQIPIDQGQPTDLGAKPASRDRRHADATQWTYRQLVARGFAAGEAANLTAYLNRLPIGDQPWSLTQVNTLLFLRRLRISGRFGGTDR